MITLYTPSTGFPDLEVKIAYGLARVGIEAGYDLTLTPEKGYYKVTFNTDNFDKGNQAFLIILKRILSSDRFFDLGVKAKDKGRYSATEKCISEISKTNLSNIFTFKVFSDLNIKKDYFCGHKNISKFGGSSGLILISSFHAGKPYERDKRFSTFNQSLCAICGYLAVLGLHSFAFNIHLGTEKNKKYCIVLPIPKKEINSSQIQLLFSLQKLFSNFWLSDILPLKTFIIGLLSKVPSVSEIVKDLNLYFHLSLLSKDRRGDTIVEQTAFVDALPYAKFILDNPFNAATIENLLGSSKEKPKISSLLEITNFIEHKDINNLLKFARLYVQETSRDKFINLLYPDTTKYLLKEVAMIKEEIIKNKAVRSLAKTLGYFVWNKDYQNYSYADNLRNAKKPEDAMETFKKLMREAKLRYDQEKDKKDGNPPYLPHPEDIEEINHLMQLDFEQVITALYLLAFSFESYKTITIEP